MKCEKCGEELPEFAKFCLFCGSAVSEEESDEAESVDAEKDVDVEAEDPGAEDVTEGDLEDAQNFETDAEKFKRRYKEFYTDIKISHKEDW